MKATILKAIKNLWRIRITVLCHLYLITSKKKHPKIRLVGWSSFGENNEKQFVKFGGHIKIATGANNDEAIGLFLDIVDLYVEAIKNCTEVKDRLPNDFGIHNLHFVLHLSDPEFRLQFHPSIAGIVIKNGHIYWTSELTTKDKNEIRFEDSDWYRYEDIAKKYNKFRPSNNNHLSKNKKTNDK